MDTPFSQANISPETGTLLMEAMSLNAFDIQNPVIFRRFLDVAQYLGKYADGVHVARVVTSKSTPKDRLDKLWGYVQLRKELDTINSELTALAPEMEEDRARLTSAVSAQRSELSMYE